MVKVKSEHDVAIYVHFKKKLSREEVRAVHAVVNEWITLKDLYDDYDMRHITTKMTIRGTMTTYVDIK